MKCEFKECTRKRSGSEPSGQKSAELSDARHARLLVRGSHTLANAQRTRDASSEQQRRRRCGGQDGDDDLRPILLGSCENEGDWQSRSFFKHSRRAYSKAAERGRQIDRYWPDHHYTEVTGTQETTSTQRWYRGDNVSLPRTGTSRW